MHDNQLVSIIMPVYNGNKYLAEAVKSVIDQTYSDWELLIINDGSTDNSQEIIAQFASTDSRIKSISNDNNIGLQLTLNRGLQMARGSLVARLDSDDRWCLTSKLEKQVKFLTDNPDYALVGTQTIIIDGSGNRCGDIDLPSADEKIRNQILLRNCFVHSSVVFRKIAAFQCDMYRVTEKYVEDYGLWLRFGRKYKFANLLEHATELRRHSDTISYKSKIGMPINSFKLILKNSRYYPNALFAIIRGLGRIMKGFLKAIL